MIEKMEDGWYDDVENEWYHARPELSKTRMSKLFGPQPKPGEETLEFGEMFHTAVLEPDTFDSRYIVMPEDCKQGSGAGMKARKEEFLKLAEFQGKKIVDPKNIEPFKRMREAVLSHPKVIELGLLQDGEVEKTGFFFDPEYQVGTKVRLDFLNQAKGLITDLKSTKACTEREFTKQAYNLDYDLQAAHNCYVTTQITGVTHDKFYFIAVNKKPSYDFVDKEIYGVMVYEADQEFLNNGLIKRAKALTKYNECKETGTWPDYSKELETLSLPGWVRRKEDMRPIIE